MSMETYLTSTQILFLIVFGLCVAQVVLSIRRRYWESRLRQEKEKAAWLDEMKVKAEDIHRRSLEGESVGDEIRALLKELDDGI